MKLDTKKQIQDARDIAGELRDALHAALWLYEADQTGLNYNLKDANTKLSALAWTMGYSVTADPRKTRGAIVSDVRNALDAVLEIIVQNDLERKFVEVLGTSPTDGVR